MKLELSAKVKKTSSEREQLEVMIDYTVKRAFGASLKCLLAFWLAYALFEAGVTLMAVLGSAFSAVLFAEALFWIFSTIILKQKAKGEKWTTTNR